MRLEDIKFKGKRYDNNQWVEGYFYEESGSTYIIDDRQKKSILNRNTPHKVDPTTVCQFTGLKDCNGKGIWEHDLLRNKLTKSTFEVVWNKECASFTLKYISSGEISTNQLGFLIDNFNFSVVGNEFDKEV